MKKEVGVSLIECIISFFLIGILLKISIKDLNYSLFEYKLAEKENKISQNKAILASILNLIKKDIELQPLNFIPKIHPKGKLLFSDLTEHKFSENLNEHFSPISFLNINFKDSLRVKEKKKLNIIACEIFENGKYLKGKYRSFLGISNNYYFELKIVESEKIAYKPDCFKLNLDVSKSILFESRDLNLSNYINYLVPIKAIYTYILDKDKTLRYLSFVNNEIIENQPIADKFPLFNFKKESNKMIIKSNFFEKSIIKEVSFIKDNNFNILFNLR